MTISQTQSPLIEPWKHWLGLAAVIIVTAAILLSMGREPICKCGFVKLWEGEPASPGNSQHVSDWYTPSHVIHGILFYLLLWPTRRKLSLAARLLAATFLESAWEIFENTDFIIQRYRTTTISLDYYGDSVLNSVVDVLAMVVGFFMAGRFPVWAVVAFAFALEVGVAVMIRDNLTLNIVMLLWPSQAILDWQAGA
jgi:small-conductance mechanosensitive channel